MTGREPVAVVGMGVHLPGAPDLATYWHNLRHGVDAIEAVPSGRHDEEFHADGPDGPERTYCHRGGFVEASVPLDLRRFGIMPNSVDGMEPDQLLALRVAAEALADAGGTEQVGSPSRTGVVLGRGGYLSPGLARYEQRVRTVPQLLRTVRQVVPGLAETELEALRTALLDDLGPHSPESTIGLVPNLAASRVANRLDLRGPAYTVDAACASSLIAVDHAMSELAAHRCDAVLAGGVHHTHDETLWSTFTQLGALSRTGRIAPLSAGADGLLIGEGTGVVVLKRLADAERDGNRIYAVITGVGVASDGRSASLFAPDSGGQAAAVRAAWREAGADPCLPGSVGMLEAHGTATPAGDAAELATLATVFGPRVECHARAVIGSVKSMIGHTMPAAGVASLIKSALALHHATLLPTLHCDEPSPLLARTRFDVLARAREWPRSIGPRRAGVNAFGFGGINAHVVLEESPAARRGRPTPARSPEPAARVPEGRGPSAATAVTAVAEPETVLRLAAATVSDLAALLDRPDRELADLPVGDGPCRVGLVGPTPRRIDTARKVVRRSLEQGPASWRGRADVWFTAEPLLPAGRTVFVFPGLEAAFAPRCDDVAAWLGRAAPEQESRVGEDLFGHADAVMDVGRMLDAACRRLRLTPDALAGHSVGEWAAMAVGGMFGAAGSGTDPAVLRRRFFSGGFEVPDVEFAAMGCAVDEARERAGAYPDVVVSHDNAPRQSVVCGPTPQVAALLQDSRADGVVARALPFRSGFHTPMLAGLLQPFHALARSLPMHTPSTPVWSCTAADRFPDDPAQVRELYLRHLTEPVRFRETVCALWESGHRFFVTMGPGQVGSFVSDTLGEREHLVVAAASSARDGLAQLRRVACAFWVEGGEPDLGALSSSATHPATRAATACVPTARPPDISVRLGVSALRLGPGTVTRLRAHSAPAVPAAPDHEASGPDGLPEPIAAGLSALRAETEAATAAVLAAVRATPVEKTPDGPTDAPRRPDDGRDGTRTAVVPVSMESMPHLRGHRFFRQRPGWPDGSDHRPVVPATAVLELAIDQACRQWPDLVVTGVRNARFTRWLIAEPAHRVTVHLQRRDDGHVEVAVGDFAVLTLCTGGYPDLPGPGLVPLDDAPAAEDLHRAYDNRYMFHGPGYQGLTRITGLGAGHARAPITVPEAPGALLDNVGQLLGIWMFAHFDDRLLAFPQRIDAIDLAGPLPGPGETVECLVRPSTPEPDAMVMDAELVHRGRVVATVRGWRDVRLDCDRHAHRAYAFPDRHRLSRPQPGGWVLAEDRWSTTAARDLHAGAQLGADERARYAALDPRRRRQWLIGRIAAKDAVRGLLGEPVFPAELEIVNDDAGRPWARGRHGLELPPVEVSLAHTGTVGVALAGPAGSAPGIDVEPLREASPGTVEAALAPSERPLHARLDTDGSGSWFSRFWTAKEAVAKALGSGLQGRPHDFPVLEADVDGALVRAPDGRLHQVRHRTITVAGRVHVVAWTGQGTEPTERTPQ